MTQRAWYQPDNFRGFVGVRDIMCGQQPQGNRLNRLPNNQTYEVGIIPRGGLAAKAD